MFDSYSDERNFYSAALMVNILLLLPIFFLIDLFTGVFTDVSLITFGVISLVNFIIWMLLSLGNLYTFFLNEAAVFSAFVLLRVFNIVAYPEATITFIFQLFTVLLYFSLVVPIALILLGSFYSAISGDDWGGVIAAILISIAVGITIGLFWILQFLVVFLSALTLVAQLQGDILKIGKYGTSFLKRVWYLITASIQIYIIVSYVLDILGLASIPFFLGSIVGSLYLAVIILIHIRSSVKLFLEPFNSLLDGDSIYDLDFIEHIGLLLLCFGMLIAVFLGTLDKLIYELSQPYLFGFPLVIGEVPMLSDWLIGAPFFKQELQPILMIIAIVISVIVINIKERTVFKYVQGIWD